MILGKGNCLISGPEYFAVGLYHETRKYVIDLTLF